MFWNFTSTEQIGFNLPNYSVAVSITIRPTDKVVFVGDSITEQGWFNPAVTTINTLFSTNKVYPSSATGGRAIATGGTGSVAVTANNPALQAINSGVSGDESGNISAAVATRITNYNPTVVVLAVGVNDTRSGVQTSTYRANIDTILDQTLAALPTCKIIVMSVWLIGEQWILSGGIPVFNDKLTPPPSNPTFTPWIEDMNAQLIASAAAHGAIYCDTRTPTLAYEVAHNTPMIGTFNGVLTQTTPEPSGVHPLPVGQAFLSSVLMNNIIVAP